MRYSEEQTDDPMQGMQIYSQSDGLHFMLNFTVTLALMIGLLLFWLARRGRVMWLSVWSAGLVLFSVAYLVAAMLGLIF
jgi:hypothetical protein